MPDAQTVLTWLVTIGYLGICSILFAETAFFFCFFLPGDSLLFLSGLLARRGVFDIWLLVPCIIVISFMGYWFAYWFGAQLGRWLIEQPDSFWYRRRYLDQAHAFFKRFGNKAIVLGRLLPVIRSFGGMVAGIVRMPMRAFLIYNFIGSVIWVGLFVMMGYFIGDVFPQFLGWFIVVVGVVILGTILLPLLEHLRHR